MSFWQFPRLFVVLVVLTSLSGIKSAPTVVSTSTIAPEDHLKGLHTTHGSTDFGLLHNTPAPNDASTVVKNKNVASTSASDFGMSDHHQRQHKHHEIDAKLVIANSRQNVFSDWGLTQAEAATMCNKMASKVAPSTHSPHHSINSDSPMSDILDALRARMLNRFQKQTTYKYGNLLEVDNMVKFHLLDSIYYRFIPHGTFWSGGKLVEKDGHYMLNWLQSNTSVGSAVAESPTATQLLGKSQKKIDKFAKAGKLCLVIKRSMSLRFPFSRWIDFDDNRMGNGLRWRKKFKWSLHSCDERLPYICVLHNSEMTEKDEAAESANKIDHSKATPSASDAVAHTTVSHESGIRKPESNLNQISTSKSNIATINGDLVTHKAADELTTHTVQTTEEHKGSEHKSSTAEPVLDSSKQTTVNIATASSTTN